ncbi:hypothetical protein LLH00_01500 [bacterium]|nr:hypothetical protein [bacterium]
MGCACCAIDYNKLEREIDAGRVADLERALAGLAGEGLFVVGDKVIYCPECQAAIARLQERVAARLRRQTLDGLKGLLDRAYDSRLRNI